MSNNEFEFRQKVIDGIELVDLIDILKITPEQFYDAFEEEIMDNYHEIADFLGEDLNVGRYNYEDS